MGESKRPTVGVCQLQLLEDTRRLWLAEKT